MNITQAPAGRVYQMRWWFKAFTLSFLIFGAALVITCCRNATSNSEPIDGNVLIAGVVLLIAGAGVTAKAFSSTIRFSESAIERRSIFGRKMALLKAIKGRREYVVRGQRSGTRYLRLVASDGFALLEFGKSLYAFDDAFWHWFKQLPDLDAEDKACQNSHGLV